MFADGPQVPCSSKALKKGGCASERQKGDRMKRPNCNKLQEMFTSSSNRPHSQDWGCCSISASEDLIRSACCANACVDAMIAKYDWTRPSLLGPTMPNLYTARINAGTSNSDPKFRMALMDSKKQFWMDFCRHSMALWVPRFIWIGLSQTGLIRMKCNHLSHLNCIELPYITCLYVYIYISTYIYIHNIYIYTVLYKYKCIQTISHILSIYKFPHSDLKMLLPTAELGGVQLPRHCFWPWGHAGWDQRM